MMSTKSHNSLTQQMAQHVQSWKRQKVSRKIYCQQAGMSIHKFNYWILKLRKEQHDAGAVYSGDGGPECTAGASKRNGFTPIPEAVAVSSMGPAFQVELPNGNRINFFSSLTPELLKLFL